MGHELFPVCHPLAVRVRVFTAVPRVPRIRHLLHRLSRHGAFFLLFDALPPVHWPLFPNYSCRQSSSSMTSAYDVGLLYVNVYSVPYTVHVRADPLSGAESPSHAAAVLLR